MLFEELTEIVDAEPHGAAMNMAIDEALFRGATEPILRIYQWLHPAVSFGYFGKYAAVEENSDGREMVRRWTGGGVVPHGEDLTYTLIVPSRCAFSRLPARESYRVIHDHIAAHLRRDGYRVLLAGEASGKVSDACFSNPVVFDLMADGSKIAGAAQRRAKGGLLHQGSIRIPGMDHSSRDGLAKAFAVRIDRRDLRAAELANAHVISEEKYATDVWLKKF